MTITFTEYILIALAAVAAGAINALAGGGTLITFPTLMFVGLSSIASNVTNTVALVPGYLGGTLAQKKDLRGQGRRLALFLPAGVMGGLIGGYLLLVSGEKLFSFLIPYLILFACALLAIQDPLRRWLVRRLERQGHSLNNEGWAILPVGLASIYGGYFGAGLSVIILAVLGLTLEDNLTRLNGLKQAIGFATNVAAAVYFLFSGEVVWPVAIVMAFSALIGGSLGGRLAGRIKPSTLRMVVVSIGVVVAVIYLLR